MGSLGVLRGGGAHPRNAAGGGDAHRGYACLWLQVWALCAEACVCAWVREGHCSAFEAKKRATCFATTILLVDYKCTI